MNELQRKYLEAKTALETARALREEETAHLFVEGANFSDAEILTWCTESTNKHGIGDLVRKFDAAQCALADWGVQVVARRTPSKKTVAETARYGDVRAFAELAFGLRA